MIYSWRECTVCLSVCLPRQKPSVLQRLLSHAHTHLISLAPNWQTSLPSFPSKQSTKKFICAVKTILHYVSKMSFLAVPESSVAGYPGYVLPSRIPVADVESNDAQSEPTGFCNTCLYWMFRCIPVLIIFLIINCIRAFLFDQRTAFTIINITLGLTLSAVIIISLYTFISLKFYRLQQSQTTFLPANNRAAAAIGAHRQRNSTLEISSPVINAFAYEAVESVSQQYHCTRCAARSPTTLQADRTLAGTSAGRTHARHHCPHSRTRPKKHRVSEADLPPKYEELEEPPKYDELSAADLMVKNEHCQSIAADHLDSVKPNAQL